MPPDPPRRELAATSPPKHFSWMKPARCKISSSMDVIQWAPFPYTIDHVCRSEVWTLLWQVYRKVGSCACKRPLYSSRYDLLRYARFQELPLGRVCTVNAFRHNHSHDQVYANLCSVPNSNVLPKECCLCGSLTLTLFIKVYVELKIL